MLRLKTDGSVSLPFLKWETDLSISPDLNFWTQICLNTFRMTKNPNLQFIQYKIIHRTHYTGQRMFGMGLRHSNICLDCSGNIAHSYIHAMWQCVPVQKFWQGLCEDLSTWLKYPVPVTPSLCVLGDLRI